jgi:hypothetical protein
LWLSISPVAAVTACFGIFPLHKAPEGRRTPRRYREAWGVKHSAKFWSAPARRRFSRLHKNERTHTRYFIFTLRAIRY